MKKFILILSIILFAGCAGLEPMPQSEMDFHRVVEAKGLKKDQLFDGTKMWIAETFRSAKAVIEYEDKEKGTIIGNGIIKYPCSGFNCVAKGDWKVLFTMKVDVKEDRFRLSFTNLKLKWPPTVNSLGAQRGYEGRINSRGDFETIKPALLKIGDDLLAFFKKDSKDSDW